MSETLRIFTKEEVRVRYGAAISAGRKTAAEKLLAAIEDPVEPLTSAGKRRYHPLLLTLLFVVGAALVAFVYFSFHSGA